MMDTTTFSTLVSIPTGLFTVCRNKHNNTFPESKDKNINAVHVAQFSNVLI